ncbi:hypothetical protein BpHYR1_042092 [Brachionus plicatilis]|uniref:Uncharacterized protein n=1 Tax=Brachionus plicatilis TaxID=10195 RepID=A0A3M7R9H0_BRAPC|nr:hypothetical protein BpHYR1_042092 [Brachionus plicatilis]
MTKIESFSSSQEPTFILNLFKFKKYSKTNESVYSACYLGGIGGIPPNGHARNEARSDAMWPNDGKNTPSFLDQQEPRKKSVALSHIASENL